MSGEVIMESWSRQHSPNTAKHSGYMQGPKREKMNVNWLKPQVGIGDSRTSSGSRGAQAQHAAWGRMVPKEMGTI